MDVGSIILSLQLAALTTLFLLFIGIPFAYYLSQSQRWYKSILEALVSLPLVLPPTVLGFYLLLAFSPNRGIGKFLYANFDISLVFSFWGLVLGSIIYSLPFMVHPIQNGLQALPSTLKESAYLLGKSRTETFFRVLLPNIKPAVLSGMVLSFAHTIGEFGVVLMIGGNIAGQTRVASIAVYDQVESLQYGEAHQLALVLLILSFTILLALYIFNRNGKHNQWLG